MKQNKNDLSIYLSIYPNERQTNIYSTLFDESQSKCRVYIVIYISLRIKRLSCSKIHEAPQPQSTTANNNRHADTIVMHSNCNAGAAASYYNNK